MSDDMNRTANFMLKSIDVGKSTMKGSPNNKS
jgi:hypothetical protein